MGERSCGCPQHARHLRMGSGRRQLAGRRAAGRPGGARATVSAETCPEGPRLRSWADHPEMQHQGGSAARSVTPLPVNGGWKATPTLSGHAHHHSGHAHIPIYGPAPIWPRPLPPPFRPPSHTCGGNGGWEATPPSWGPRPLYQATPTPRRPRPLHQATPPPGGPAHHEATPPASCPRPLSPARCGRGFPWPRPPHGALGGASPWPRPLLPRPRPLTWLGEVSGLATPPPP